MQVFILTGKKGEGKTFLVEELAKILSKEGLKVKGIISRGQQYKTFINLETKEQEAFWKEGDIIEEQIGDYKLSVRALTFARESIAKIRTADMLIIDEIAWLESDKKGMFEGIKKFLENIKETNVKVVLFVVRHQIVDQIEKLFELKISRIWKLERSNHDSILKQLIQECSQNME